MGLKTSPKAGSHHQPLPSAAAETLDDNLDKIYREPTEAEILASIERGLRQALAGEGAPAREWLAGLDNKR